jgi:Ca-activated chloride channel family protein
MFNFVYPLWLLLILLIPLLVYYDIFSYKKFLPKIPFPTLSILKEVSKRSSLLRYLPIFLKSLIIIFLAIALSRPRYTIERREYTTWGVDIVIAVDISGSMLAADFRPSRLEAAKRVATDFINKRENDRFAIVTFAAYATTLVPLTNDFTVLNTIVNKIEIETVQDGTAIGNGLAVATNRLKDSEAKSKIIILLTDGVNNSGQIDPISAAELAQTFGIKIYTIGIGSKGMVDYPYQHPIFGTQYRKVNIDYDMNVLHKIAQMTGTIMATEANNVAQLSQIFDNIDKLEKTEITSNVYFEHKEMFVYFLFYALLCIIILLISRFLLNT